MSVARPARGLTTRRMDDRERRNLDLVSRYLDALGAGVEGEALGEFFTADAVQEELPNRLNPAGQRSDRAQLVERSRKVKHVLRGQRYEVRSSLASGDRVALEAEWRATLAVPLGSLAPGDEMRARFAIFIELRDGRIASQRNYDCFDAF